jgi:Ca2+-binding RTX toxin-like protein
LYFGFWNPGASFGAIVSNGSSVSGGATTISYAVGAIDGLNGLPSSMNSLSDWTAFATALLAKTDQLSVGGVTVSLNAMNFVGLGGLGDDTFTLGSIAGTAQVFAGAGNDTVSGSSTADTLAGGAGNDTIGGSGGGDSLSGGAGADTISGGTGVDSFGAAALNELHGDRITDYALGETIALGQALASAANATLVTVGGDTELRIDGDNNGSFETVVTLTGAVSGAATLTSGNSVLAIVTPPPTLVISPTTLSHPEGGSGATAYTFTVTRAGDLSATSTVVWAVTSDTGNADFQGAVNRAGQTLTFLATETTKTFTVNALGDDVVEGDETFTVTLSAPTNASITTASAVGTIVNDDVAPDPGPPIGVPSGTGDDSVGGGDANDSLSGQGGDDSLAGGAGGDSMDGDAGNDTVMGDLGGDVLRGLSDNDSVDGGVGNDTVNGNLGSDTVNGGEGDDVVYGGQGADQVDGGNGSDSHVNGNIGADTVHGGLGSDTVYGGRDNDSVYGDGGDDRISGDLGDDNLFGGAGSDRFVFGRGYGHDWVGDFDFAEGDRILLAPGTAYTVTSFGGQVLLDLGGGDVIGLVGVSSFDPSYILFG